MIKEAKLEWVELLNEILWAYKTTQKNQFVKHHFFSYMGRKP